MKFNELIPTSLRSHGGFAIAIILTVGVAWGGCLAMVVLFQSTFLKPPPLSKADELVWVRSDMESQRINPGLIVELNRDWDFAEADGFAGFGRGMSAIVETASNRIDRVGGSVVTTNLMAVLGVSVQRGRGFVEEDGLEGSEPTMLVSNDAWHSVFGGEDDAIGTLYTFNGVQTRLIGVLPAGFAGPSTTAEFGIYVPLAHYRVFYIGGGDTFIANLNFHVMTGLVRIPSGPSKGLQDSLDAFFSNYVNRNPEKLELRPVIYNWKEDTFRQRSDQFRVFKIYGAVLLALCLMAIANATILVMLRAYRRRPEFLTKLALGVPTRHLLREFAWEAGALITLNAMVAGFLAWTLLRTTMAYLPGIADIERYQVLGTPSIAAVVIGVLAQLLIFTVIPFASVVRLRMGDVTHGSRGASRKLPGLPLLALAQVAVTTILIVFSFQFARAAHHVANLELGYRTEGILTFWYSFAHLNLPDDGIPPFRQEVNRAIVDLPDVENAVSGALNYLGGVSNANFYTEEDLLHAEVPEPGFARTFSGAPGFVRLVGLRMIRGRDFDISDTMESDRVVLVTETFAKQYFPEQDAIGKRMRIYTVHNPFSTIIGIIEDFHITPSEPRAPVIVSSTEQVAFPYSLVSVSSRHDVDQARRAIIGLFKEQFGHIGEPWISSAREQIDENTRELRMAAAIVSATAMLAVLLSLFGLYVVFSFSNTLRRREHAIRIAMGAASRGLVMLTARRFGYICLAGIVAGAVCAIFLQPIAGEFQESDWRNDPAAILFALLFVGVFGAVVSMASALRTLRVDPARDLNG